MSEMMNRYKVAADLWKNPLVRRIVLLVALGWAGLLLFLSWVAPWLWLKVILCFVGSLVGCSVLLLFSFSFFPIRIPPKLYSRAPLMMAIWITVAIHFWPNPTVQWFVFGGIAFVCILPLFASIAYRVMYDHLFPWFIFKASQKFDSVPTSSLGVVLCEAGVDNRYARRLAQQFQFTTGFTMPTGPARSGQDMFFLLTIDALRRFPSDFHRTLSHQVPASVIFRRGFGRSDALIHEDIKEFYRVSRGLIFEVYLLSPGEEPPQPSDLKGVISFPLVIALREQENNAMKEIVAAITDRLKASVLPIGRSESDLPAHLEGAVSAIITSAQPAVANCYCRFRFSNSDVERFLGLCDCFEVLIKSSVVYLLAEQWRQNSNPSLINLHEQLERPSLGHWTNMLRQLISARGDSPRQQSVCDFWEQPLANAPVQLISDANGSGLAWQGKLPRSHLGWLDWFVWLRNRTRGHGAVEENQVKPLWHGLHETFLNMTLQLRSLTMDSVVATARTDGQFDTHRGWDRRSSVESGGEVDGEILNPVFLLHDMNIEKDALLVSPLMIQRGHTFLLWNSIRGSAVEYIDYGTGQTLTVDLGDANPYNLWQAMR